MTALKAGPSESSGEPTLVRVVARGPGASATRDRLLREQAMAASLSALAGVLPPLRLDETPEAFTLTFRDPGTRPWSTLIRPLGRELGRFLRLAVAVTRAVGELHASGVMHLALCPDALRLGEHEDEVFVTGLSEASRLAVEAAVAEEALAEPERLPFMEIGRAHV